jgi:hypothetical protein
MKKDYFILHMIEDWGIEDQPSWEMVDSYENIKEKAIKEYNDFKLIHNSNKFHTLICSGEDAENVHFLIFKDKQYEGEKAQKLADKLEGEE